MNWKMPFRLRRKVPLRTLLSLVILAALLPPIALLAMVMVRSAQTDRQAAEESLLHQANVIASMVHGTLRSDLGMLRSIGQQVLEQGGIENGRELDFVNSHFSGRATMVPAPDPAMGLSRDWSITNLLDIEPGVSAKFTIKVPLEDEKGPYLALTADSRAISQNITFGDLTASGMLVALVDGNGRIISRSEAAQDFLGQPVPTWQALLAVNAPKGAFNAIAFDGTPISFGFSSVQDTPGWVVVVGVPKRLLDLRWQSPLIAFGLGCLVALIVAIALATLLSRRISDPIEAMVARSRALAEESGAPLPAAPKTIVGELDTLFVAQRNAHARLIDRAAELELSSKRYHAVSKVGAMVTWHTDRHGGMLDAEGWEEFTGQPIAEALGQGWRERLHVDDAPALARSFALAREQGRSTVTLEVRVLASDGDWAWVNFRGAMITDTDGRPVEWIGTLENIDDRKRLQLRISHMAYHDPLTGLPNRVRLAEHFAELWHPAKLGEAGALLYIDLDKFKLANDTFGHAAGDALLRQVSVRLSNVLRQDDLAARLGGDEFAIVLGRMDNHDYSVLVAHRIVKTLSMPFEVEGNVIEIGASVGIALFRAGEISIERLQFEADSALYRAKAGGRNRWSFNSDESRQDISQLA